ncbi:MAG TPA: M1 family aminopeptidase [Sunxiuqinia sp.]|nr:M1 family aminopeptidase [Sunxiuqinia sp.]
MNRKFLALVIGTILFPLFGKTQDFGSHDKMPFMESRSYLKKANFIEDSTYTNWDLVFQRMNWKVDPAIRAISGEITSYFKPLIANFSSVKFDLKDNMTVDSVKYHVASKNFTHESDKITIDFQSALSPNTLDSISVWYHGVPTSTGFGSFEATNTPLSNPIMWTLSEPYGAMEWWPCKQSLQDKIDSIEVEVTCPEGNKAASNGKLIQEKTVNGKTFARWRHNYPIATYLVAIAVTNYAAFSDTLTFEDGRKMPILNYVYPSYLEVAKTKSTNIRNIMTLYNSLIGDYPFADEKYGHAQFGWGGGMEHQTMSFMYNLNFRLVAHEMAHQWFGDCITLSSWHNIWLNEGFATFLEGLTRKYLLDSTSWYSWRISNLSNIVSKPDGSVFVEDTTSVLRIFDSRLTYDKGAYLLRMLQWELGDSAFFNGLRSYFNDPKIKYGFASQEDFVTHMEAAGDTSLTEFFNDWYYGQGYPTYQISHYTDFSDNGKYKLMISQTTSDPSVDFFPMHVPLRVWQDGNSQDVRLYQTTNPQTFELSEKPDSIQFDPELWLISKNSMVTDAPEIVSNNNWKVFPNPTTAELHVQLPNSERANSISVFNLKGQKLIQSDQPVSNKINVRNLADGFYIIQIKSNGTTYRRQFVKN